MDTWIILIGIAVFVLFAIYQSGAESEKVLDCRWVAQFKDQDSKDVIVRIFSSKEMYEGSRDLKSGDFNETLHHFNSIGESARGAFFSEREQEFFSHPAISKPVAPLSFHPVHGQLPPKAVINWLDLMALLSGQELMAVRYHSEGASSSEESGQKLMIDCPSCDQKMNIPFGKIIRVTCPHCKNKFKATT